MAATIYRRRTNRNEDDDESAELSQQADDKPFVLPQAKSGDRYSNSTPGKDDMASLLFRYADLPEISDEFQNYHAPSSCGKDIRPYRQNATFEDSLRQNRIFCRFADASQFTPENPATKKDIDEIRSSRRKVCLCEVQRRLAMEKHKHLDGDQYNHEAALKAAATYCKQCAQMERELEIHGYLVNTEEIEKHDAIVQLLLAQEALFDLDGGSPDVTDRARYMWDDILPSHPILRPLRKSMSFDTFRDSLQSVQNFLTNHRSKEYLPEIEQKRKKIEKRLSHRKKKLEMLKNREALARLLRDIYA
jgi:hypothetical protein